MSTIITRNSATSGSVPSSLIQGELAINVKDGRLFYGSGSGNVVREFTGSGGGGGGTVNTGSFATTGSNIFIGNQIISGSLHQSGTFYPDQIDWFSSSIGYDTGSYILTTTANGLTTYANYQDVANTLAPYIPTVSSSVSASYAQTASYAPAYLPLTGGTINGNVTVNGTASIAFLNVTYESASVIYSSGSNQFGDASNDVQTLWGTVDIKSGPVLVTGSVIANSFTGSLLGTASYATNALSASYAPSTPAFPYTGSAGITGSLTVVGPTTSTQIGAGAAPSGSVPLDVRAQGALSTDLAFRVRNSANNANLGAIYGNGTVNLGNSNFDFQSTETSGRTAVIGASNTGASYNTYSILSLLGHNNSIASYGHTSYVGINSSINQNSGGTVTGMGESNTLSGGTIGIGMNNSIAGNANNNMNSGIGYNNAIQYEKTNTFLLGNNLRVSAAGAASMTKIGWANSAGTLAQIDRSFEVYLNGQSGSDFHVTGKTNVVLKNNSVLVSGTNYEAAATNVLTIHNGVAPITNIAGAFQLYSTASTAGNAKPYFRTENGTVVWLGDESRLFNVTASRTIISSSQNTISGSSLTIYGSGSAQPVFTVQGSQGELFSITDSLSGSLFSVNDISGLPIMEVFSDNTTLMGSYLAPSLNTTAKVVQTNSGSFTMYSLPTASYDTAFFEYSVRSGSNARAGTIMAVQLGSAVNFTETTTTDFGSTSAVSFTVIVTGSNIALTGSSTSGAWTIKTIVRSI
jgi:hypothetical protein